MSETKPDEQSEITYVPLKSLVVAEENTRKTSQADSDIPALADQIASDGKLLKPLLAYNRGKTQRAVYDGRRRIFALKILDKEKRLPANCQSGVPIILGSKEDARRHSLSAGITVRKFHPAEEYRQFQKMIDDGKSVDDIAKMFGASEKAILKRLKLARVAPRIFDAFAADEITLDRIMAYALVDDHDRQLHVYDKIGISTSPSCIRALLTEGEVPETDKRAIFVGADAFEAAGGKVTRDLFEETPDMFDDAGLLDALVDAKLKEAAIAIKAEGWAWVETKADFDDAYHQTHFRVHPKKLEKSEDIEAEETRLAERYDEIADCVCDEDDLTPGELEELNAITLRLEEIERAHTEYETSDLERGGAVLSIDRSGALCVMRGLVERPAQTKKNDVVAGDCVYPHSVHNRLTQIATQSLARALAQDAEAADIVLTATLAFSTFGFGSTSGVGVNVSGLTVDEDAALPVDHKLAERQEHFAERMGGTLPETIAMAAALEPKERTELRTLCIAASLKFDEGRADQRDHHARAAAEAIAAQLKNGCDLREYWKPDEAFFAKLKISTLLTCLEEMGVKGSQYQSLKKKELVAIATREAAKCDWTPEPARFVTAQDSTRMPKINDAPEQAAA